jgi:hypothetical protein
MTMDGIGHGAGPALAGLLLALFGASAVLLAAGLMFIAVAYIALTSSIGEREHGAAPAPATEIVALPETAEAQP